MLKALAQSEGTAKGYDYRINPIAYTPSISTNFESPEFIRDYLSNGENTVRDAVQ